MQPEFVYCVPKELGATGQETAEREAKELHSELLGKGARNMSEIKVEIRDSNVISSWVIDGERYFHN